MHCRFLYIVGQLSAGGLERQLCGLLQALDRRRYPVAVLVWNLQMDDVFLSQLREAGVPVVGFAPGISLFHKMLQCRKLILSCEPEVVHSYSFYTNFAAYCCSLGVKVIPVGSIRSDFVADRATTGVLLGRLSARYPRFQIANNMAAKVKAEADGGAFRPRKVVVVRNALNLDYFKVTEGPPEIAHIVGVGALRRVKRWERLLEGARRLAAEGLRFEVTLVGEGPERVGLEQQARRLGLESCVRFMGLHVDVPGLLARSSFLVLTSEREGCPNVVMEAMACGRAVVATAVGDVSWVVEDGVTGFVVPCDDAAILTERMRRLITDPGLCHRMGVAGRERALREFRLDRLSSETLMAYRAAGWRDR